MNPERPHSPAPSPPSRLAAIARLAIRHPGRTRLLAVFLALVGVAILLTRGKLDSEVLNLLPQRFDSVQGLKILNREFSQGNELTFALWDKEGGADMDAFGEFFGEELRKEPWVVRVMDGVPMESPEGIAEIQTLAVPLLLNLPPEQFTEALERLEPAALSERMARKKAEIEAGSLKAEFELNLDPTGLVIEALKPMASSFSMDGNRPFSSTDGTVRVAVAVVRESSFRPEGWQAVTKKPEDLIMEQVDAFRERVRKAWQEQEEAATTPEVLVTGRIPYVAEMSQGMKYDIWVTVLGSVVMVCGVFYFGFRRVRPLVGIVHILLFCCLFAVAVGTVLFGSLNVVTMGVCAIMIGIGVDFGMLLYGAYQAHRDMGQDHETAAVEAVSILGRGILFGAGTAAASFSSLTLSESPGFAQLGVLIGVGVLTAAFMMMTVFFTLLSRGYKPGKRDLAAAGTERYVSFLTRHPKAVGLATLALLVGLGLFAFSPWGRVRVEMDPKALEPADSKAGFALRMITTKVPAAEVDPVLAIVVSDDEADFQQRWAKAQARWVEAKEKGEIKSVSSPAAFAINPANHAANLAKVAGHDFSTAHTALGQALDHEGFDREAFQAAFGLIDSMQALSGGDRSPIDWRTALPEASSWIFVIDRFLSPTPYVGMAYITPNKTISSQEEQAALREIIEVPGVNAHLTGWTYVVADLIPWSKNKLMLLSVVMVGFITIVLAFLYRAVAPLAVLLCSLALSMGAMVAGLKLTGLSLNLFNVLAFPLVLGVGVDYGIYTILAVRQKSEALATIIKPIILSGLTTIAGFASLGLATHPALATLGLVCALGVACCLFSTLFLILPVYLWKGYR